MKKAQETVKAMATLIKNKMPEITEEECGKLAKELYISTMRKIANS